MASMLSIVSSQPSRACCRPFASLRPVLHRQCHARRVTVAAQTSRSEGRKVTGKCYITKDNIDTDQIIPAEYLTLVPSKPEEYEKLGSYALVGLPEEEYPIPFVAPGSKKTEYSVIIGGDNFGCGSSREHAPVCLGAAGSQVVVARSFARIFFRNCVATGELYPVECDTRLCDELSTGSEVEVDMEKDVLTDLKTGKKYNLKPLGDAGPVIDAGGLFAFARREGMIESAI